MSLSALIGTSARASKSSFSACWESHPAWARLRFLALLVDGSGPEEFAGRDPELPCAWAGLLQCMTKEFFVPRFLERDEAIRRPECDEFPWDGVGDVRPFQSGTKAVIEGVY